MATPKSNLREAARARFAEGLPWSMVAEQAAIPERTLRSIRERRDPEWLAAIEEVCAELEDEALPAAVGCLVRMATFNDVSAAKTIYERYKAAKHEITGTGFVVVKFDDDDEGAGAEDAE